jgi:tyrosyl-tRNA synthetase
MEPTFTLDKSIMDGPILAIELFKLCGLCKSLTEAKNIAKQNGLTIDGQLVKDDDRFWFTDFPCILKRGKKSHCRIMIEERD